MLGLQIGRAFDRVVLVDVLRDRLDPPFVVPERLQGEGDRAVDDLEPPQSIMKLIVPVGASTVACAFR